MARTFKCEVERCNNMIPNHLINEGLCGDEEGHEKLRRARLGETDSQFQLRMTKCDECGKDIPQNIADNNAGTCGRDGCLEKRGAKTG